MGQPKIINNRPLLYGGGLTSSPNYEYFVNCLTELFTCDIVNLYKDTLILSKNNKKRRDTMKRNPYQTNKGGEIKAPTSPSAGDPKATVKTGSDLRAPKGRK